MSTMRPLPLEAGMLSAELLFGEGVYAPKLRALDNRVVAPTAPRNLRRENCFKISLIIVLLRNCAFDTGPRFRAISSPKEIYQIKGMAYLTWWDSNLKREN